MNSIKTFSISIRLSKIELGSQGNISSHYLLNILVDGTSGNMPLVAFNESMNHR